MSQRQGMRHVFACAWVALFAHQSASAEPLQPTGKWVVDFGDNRCVAQRIYGDAAKPVYLLLKASAIGEGLQLSVAVKGPNGYGVQEKAKLSFGGGEPVDHWQLRYGVDKKRVRMVNLAKADVERLAKATELRWDTANLDYSFPLGPMSNLVKVMEECRAGLGEYWNATPEKVVSLKQEPRTERPIVKLFNNGDYPNQAVFAHQSGTAKVIALVDEKGKLVDCMIVETSGIAVLDVQTCLIMHQRGRFLPAIGADGKPTKGVISQRIRWEMPG